MRYKILFAVFFLAIASAGYAMDPEIEASKPESHRVGWMTSHQQAAKSDPKSCNMCHKPFFCVDCHGRRDTISERVHKRNFKFYHSIEARANPRKCDACHKISFCTGCHANPK